MSFAGQNLFCPSNRLFDMQKPDADINAIRLAEVDESGANSNLPSLIQQQPPRAAMLCQGRLLTRIAAWCFEFTRHQPNYLQSSVAGADPRGAGGHGPTNGNISYCRQ